MKEGGRPGDWRFTDGTGRLIDGGQRVTDGSWRVTDGGGWSTNGGQRLTQRCTRGRPCPARARRTTFVLTIPTSTPH